MSDTLVYPIGDKLYFNLTNKCTNACDFCIRNGREGMGNGSLWLKEEHTTAEYLALLPKKGAFREVVFCGFGEPIMRLDALLTIGRALRERGIPVRINTNGQGNLIYGRNIAPDLATAVDIASVSLNAPSAAGYDAICHSTFGQAAFDGLLAFTRDCVAAKINTVLTVVDTIGEEQIALCRKIAEQVGAKLRVRNYE